ncbi:MAG: GH36 C-terminal domain-containing protein, partial [Planctomycetes bacterium]|nr:GH36 C-terminal domain-containing protein [Planctomycetota bacterium]
LRPYMLGDFHPLLPHSADEEVWYGYQFNRPDQGDGMVQLFRREKCRQASQAVRVFGLDPAAMYVIMDCDTEGATKVSGQDLMEKGLVAEIKDKPGAAVITYGRAKEGAAAR